MNKLNKLDELFKNKLEDFPMGESPDAGWEEFASKFAQKSRFSWFKGPQSFLTWSVAATVVTVGIVAAIYLKQEPNPVSEVNKATVVENIDNQPTQTETESALPPASQAESAQPTSISSSTSASTPTPTSTSSNDVVEIQPVTSVSKSTPTIAIAESAVTHAAERPIATVEITSQESAIQAVSTTEIETIQAESSSLNPPLPVALVETGKEQVVNLMASLTFKDKFSAGPSRQTDFIRFPEKSFKHKPLFSTTIFGSLNKGNMPLILKDPNQNATFEYTQKAVIGTETEEYGLNLSWYYKDFILESGIGYLSVSQFFGDVMPQLTLQEVNTWDVFDTSYQVVDTVGSYLQISNSDSTWYYFIETNLVSSQDSILMTSYDTSASYEARKADNNFRYVDIPLVAGYNLSYGRYSGLFKTGIITSLLHKSSGYLITGPGEEDVIPISSLDIPVLRFDWYVAAEARYMLTSRYFISAEGFYRRSLKEEYFTSYINRKVYQSGIKIGLGMYF